MKRIVLISCVSIKQPCRSKAKDLYTSPRFQKNLAYARRLNPDAIDILSAKYGLLDLEADVDPYEQTLNAMSAGEIRTWAQRVLYQLDSVSDVCRDRFVFPAGTKCRRFLIPWLSSYQIPFEGLRNGEQLRALSR